MSKFIKMKKGLFSMLLVVITFSSCRLFERDKNIECIRPYTEKELSFIDSLGECGLKVELSRFNYPYTGDSVDECIRSTNSSYTIFINNHELEQLRNLDSMRLKARTIATELYTKIISDFIISNSSEIEVWLQSKPVKKSDEFGRYYSAKFKKKDLECYCGFYIEDKNTHFSREKIAQSCDSLIISDESPVD